MIEVKPFEAGHLEKMLQRPIQDEALRKHLTPVHAAEWAKRGTFYTIIEDGWPVVIGGINEYWKGRGEAWLLMGQFKTNTFYKIFRVVKRFLKMTNIRRIEMTVDTNFKQGHRWAELLGFSKEAEIMRAYRPDGGDVSLYAMVRG